MRRMQLPLLSQFYGIFRYDFPNDIELLQITRPQILASRVDNLMASGALWSYSAGRFKYLLNGDGQNGKKGAGYKLLNRLYSDLSRS